MKPLTYNVQISPTEQPKFIAIAGTTINGSSDFSRLDSQLNYNALLPISELQIQLQGRSYKWNKHDLYRMTKMCCPVLDDKFGHDSYTDKTWNYISESTSPFLSGNLAIDNKEGYLLREFVSNLGSYQYTDIPCEGYVVILDLFQHLNFEAQCSNVNCQITAVYDTSTATLPDSYAVKVGGNMDLLASKQSTQIYH